MICTIRFLFVCALLTSGCATNDAITRTRPHYVEPKNPEDFRAIGRTVPGNPAYYVLLPFTIPFDVATSPIQFATLMIAGVGAKVPKPSKAGESHGRLIPVEREP